MSPSGPRPWPATDAGGGWRLRPPDPGDGAALHALVTACPPLDPNSVYAYLLQGLHFADTCALAERDGRLAGYVAAYRPPGRPDTLFVWQVAIAPPCRGQRLGRRLLDHLIARPALAGLRWVEATVAPANAASRRLFQGLARDLGCPCTVQPLFGPEAFGPEPHDAEPLLRIGPFAHPAHCRKEDPDGHLDL